MIFDLTLLDGPSLGGLVGFFSIFILLPAIALIVLIYVFIKHRKKKQ